METARATAAKRSRSRRAGRRRPVLGFDDDATASRFGGDRHVDGGGTAPLAQPGDECGEGGSLVVAEVGRAADRVVDDHRDATGQVHVRGEVVEPRRLDARLQRPSERLGELASAVGVGHRDAVGGHHAGEEREHLASEHGHPALLHRPRDAGAELGVAVEGGTVRLALPGECLVDDRVRVARGRGRHREHRRGVHGDECADGCGDDRGRRRTHDEDRQHGGREHSREQERDPAAERRERQDQHADDDRAEVVVDVPVGADGGHVLRDRRAHGERDDQPQPLGRERRTRRRGGDRGDEPRGRDQRDAEHGGERRSHLVPVRAT